MRHALAGSTHETERISRARVDPRLESAHEGALTRRSPVDLRPDALGIRKMQNGDFMSSARRGMKFPDTAAAQEMAACCCHVVRIYGRRNSRPPHVTDFRLCFGPEDCMFQAQEIEDGRLAELHVLFCAIAGHRSSKLQTAQTLRLRRTRAAR